MTIDGASCRWTPKLKLAVPEASSGTPDWSTGGNVWRLVLRQGAGIGAGEVNVGGCGYVRKR